MAKYPFSQTFQENAPCLKLFRICPYFETRFSKSSFNVKLDFLNRVIMELNFKKKKKIVELEFLENIQVELEFIP